MSKMKVAILNLWFKIGGTENAMIGMVNELLKHDAEVTIISYYDIGDIKSRIPQSVKLEYIDHPFIMETLLMHYSSNVFIRYIQKIIHKSIQLVTRSNSFAKMYSFVLSHQKRWPEKYDLLLDFYGYGNYLTAFGARNVDALRKATWLHDENVSFAEYVRPFYDDYDAIYCVSNAVKHNLLCKYPELSVKTDVFMNFIDVDRIKTLANEGSICVDTYNEKFCILTIGRLKEQKGIDIAIEVASILKSNGVEFNWFVLGDGYDREKLEVLIHERGQDDTFHLLGNKENPYPYICQCDLYVQPSRHEGYCTTLVEAKTLNKAILSSNILSARDLIEDGVNGYLCDLTPTDLAVKIEKIINDRDMIKRVEDNLKKEQTYKFNDYNKIVNLMGDVINE